MFLRAAFQNPCVLTHCSSKIGIAVEDRSRCHNGLVCQKLIISKTCKPLSNIQFSLSKIVQLPKPTSLSKIDLTVENECLRNNRQDLFYFPREFDTWFLLESCPRLSFVCAITCNVWLYLARIGNLHSGAHGVIAAGLSRGGWRHGGSLSQRVYDRRIIGSSRRG